MGARQRTGRHQTVDIREDRSPFRPAPLAVTTPLTSPVTKATQPRSASRSIAPKPLPVTRWTDDGSLATTGSNLTVGSALVVALFAAGGVALYATRRKTGIEA